MDVRATSRSRSYSVDWVDGPEVEVEVVEVAVEGCDDSEGEEDEGAR